MAPGGPVAYAASLQGDDGELAAEWERPWSVVHETS